MKAETWQIFKLKNVMQVILDAKSLTADSYFIVFVSLNSNFYSLQ